MTPITYNIIDANKNEISFHYDYRQLKSFLSHGFKEGNNGVILVKQKGNYNIYRGFGTIESPCKSLRTISIQHNEFFDGKRLEPEQIINPKETSPLSEPKLVMLNFSNIEFKYNAYKEANILMKILNNKGKS
jgi:hypothetical protein